jgi:hypothetical protein
MTSFRPPRRFSSVRAYDARVGHVKAAPIHSYAESEVCIEARGVHHVDPVASSTFAMERIAR